MPSNQELGATGTPEEDRSHGDIVDTLRARTSLFSTFGYYFGVIATYFATVKTSYGIALAILGLGTITQMLIPLGVLIGGLLLMKLCEGTTQGMYGHASLACLISAVLLAIEAIFLLMSGFLIPFAVCLALSGGLLAVGRYIFPEDWLHVSTRVYDQLAKE